MRLLPAVRRAATVLIAASVLAVLSPGAAHAAGTRSFAGDFPDPEVLVHTRDGVTTYWAYSTNSAEVYANLPVMSSRDLVGWTERKDALPWLPSWAEPGRTWAPSVVAVGKKHVLYYTAWHRASGRQCLSRAVSTKGPGGPFSDSSSAPLVCQLDLGGSIDPDAFRDSDGRLYLHWKSDENAVGKPSRLWGARLTSDGLSLATGAARLLAHTPGTWEDPLVEAPTMVRTSAGYRLFYSANWWESATAGVGYATCSGPLSPCSTATPTAPWLAQDGARVGPAGQTFFHRGTTQLVAYHAWAPGKVGYANGGKRSLWIQSVTFDSNGTPVLGS